MLLGPVASTDPAVLAEHSAFHAHLGRLNQPRLVPLLSVLALLLFISAVLAIAPNPATLWQVNGQNWTNVWGVLLCALVLGLVRVSSPQFASQAYVYAILGWGNANLFLFVAESRLRHADHAAEQLLVYFITRYLAGLGVVSRPRNLGIAMALNHILVAVVFYWQGQIPLVINFAVWTTTAWLASYLLYRAERDAFLARRSLQQQRDALVAANGRLEQLNQEKNDLMAIAAHDLRSPLMGMTMLLNLAAEDASKVWAAGVGTLRAIEQSGRDMAELVTRVLDAHQADGTPDQLAIAGGDISPLIARVMAAQQAVAKAKGIALLVHTDRPCLAMHDPLALGRVIENLGSNAIKFSPSGSSVRVTVSPGRNGNGPQIEVTDSGPGISDDERPRLFRKFARLRAKPTAGESSSGLGLYIVKRLVDGMGGSIDVTSAAGGGASFIVTLCPQTP